TSVCQKTGSWRTDRKLAQPTPIPLCATSSGSPYCWNERRTRKYNGYPRIAPIVTTTGRIRRYGAARWSARERGGGRRRRGERAASAAASTIYGLFSVVAMFWSAQEVASLMLSFPVRMRASIVRRTFPFSTLTQFFAVGTNQLRAAARSFTLVPSRLVA